MIAQEGRDSRQMSGKILDLEYRHIFKQNICDARITFTVIQEDLFLKLTDLYSVRFSVHITGALSDNQARKTARAAIREHFKEVGDLRLSLKRIGHLKYIVIVSGLCSTE